MEFLEYYSGGLRSPVLIFERDDRPIEFRLFPTVQIGDPAYYAELGRRLAACDWVLYEYGGPADPEEVDGHRTMARKLGLVSQIDAFDYAALPEHWIHADLAPEMFQQAVAALPDWKERAQFTTRGQALIAKFLALLPAPSRREVAEALDMSYELHAELAAVTPLERLILDDRNAVVFRHLDQYAGLRLPPGVGPFTVGVFYGAAHMPAISSYLYRPLGYRCLRGEWIEPPVFTE